MIIAIASIHGEAGYVEPILPAALDGLRPSGAGGLIAVRGPMLPKVILLLRLPGSESVVPRP